MKINTTVVAIAVTSSSFVFLCIGVLIGWYSGPDRVSVNPAQATVGSPEDITKNLSNIINNEVLDDTLRFLTMDPHVSGSHSEYVIAQHIRDKFIEYGLDSSEMSSYNILLSSPSRNSEETNVVQRLSYDISQPEGYRIAFQSTVYEPVLDEESVGKDIPSAFNAYSPSGTVQGDLLYANYAAMEDFQHLLNDKEINITDKIVIARYGKIHNGDKAKLAAKFGAKGLILYSDPADYNVEGGPIYPQGTYLPSHGILRGSVLQVIGDPLTPLFPAIGKIY
ncbi:glutamate carboxypeptidase 2-like [Apostichopus japonicus]|uniref:glutamate carboxypeptidase 2-like n=1 Tax=Stichopus japonicus TaxID=307972 RepID=UPI003AB76D22